MGRSKRKGGKLVSTDQGRRGRRVHGWGQGWCGRVLLRSAETGGSKCLVRAETSSPRNKSLMSGHLGSQPFQQHWRPRTVVQSLLSIVSQLGTFSRFFNLNSFLRVSVPYEQDNNWPRLWSTQPLFLLRKVASKMFYSNYHSAFFSKNSLNFNFFDVKKKILFSACDL